MLKKLFILLMITLICFKVNINPAYANEKEEFQIAIGQWRTHLNYRNAIHIIESGNRIYCATKSGLFYIDKSDNSINKLDRTLGLSGVEITAAGFHENSESIFIAYDDMTIDILRANSITKISHIKNFQITGIRRIQNFTFHNDLVYISTSFGISVYSITNSEFVESFLQLDHDVNQINVNSVSVYNNYLYAATSSGMYKADLNSPNLQDPQFWEKFENTPSYNMIVFNNKLYADKDSILYVFDGSEWKLFEDPLAEPILNLNISNNHLMISNRSGISVLNADNVLSYQHNAGSSQHAIIDKDGITWNANDFYSLIRINPNGSIDFINPNGPHNNSAFQLKMYKDNLWVVSGGVLQGYINNTFNTWGFYKFFNNRWVSYNRFTNNFLENNVIFDLITIAGSSQKNELYMGSFYNGLIKFNTNSEEFTIYNTENSLLSYVEGSSSSVRVTGLEFDENDNLWMANYGTENPLVLKTFDNKWYQFKLPVAYIAEITIDHSGQLWILLPRTPGIMVVSPELDYSNPFSAKTVILSENEGNGNLPDNKVNAVVVDKNGEVWLGTNDGIGVIYSPSNIFQDRNYDANKIWVSHEGEEGFLLRRQIVTAMAVDAGNRKWIATAGGGVWVTSPTGTNIIHNFNVDNSPLLSNNIQNITFNENTGEMFFITDKGLISYRSQALKGQSIHENILVFPNPVREDYDGTIAIKGLVDNALVKITDINGRLVYETQAIGGQAVWNGKNFSGNRPASGVYMVFSTNSDGLETYTTKFLMISK